MNSKSPRFYIPLVAFLLVQCSLWSQHDDASSHADQDVHEEAHPFKHHAIAFFVGHTHIINGVKDGTDNNWLVLPSLGLDYNYIINSKWGVGLHTEMIIEEFIVGSNGGHDKSGSGEEIVGIERGRPIAIAAVGLYRAHKHVTILVGGGMEFSEHEDFGLVKLGLEFPYHFAENWEFYGALTADFKVDAYNSFGFGLGVARLF